MKSKLREKGIYKDLAAPQWLHTAEKSIIPIMHGDLFLCSGIAFNKKLVMTARHLLVDPASGMMKTPITAAGRDMHFVLASPLHNVAVLEASSDFEQETPFRWAGEPDADLGMSVVLLERQQGSSDLHISKHEVLMDEESGHLVVTLLPEGVAGSGGVGGGFFKQAQRYLGLHIGDISDPDTASGITKYDVPHQMIEVDASDLWVPDRNPDTAASSMATSAIADMIKWSPALACVREAKRTCAAYVPARNVYTLMAQAGIFERPVYRV